MRRQDPGLNKALATTHAHVGLLASVGAGMSCQVAGLDKPLATGHTHTQGFSPVWVAGMPRQVAGLGKALATGRTHEQDFFAPVVVRWHRESSGCTACTHAVLSVSSRGEMACWCWGRFLDGVIRQAPDHARAHMKPNVCVLRCAPT